MTVLRMDNVLVVVDHLKAAIAFFVELGLELEGEATADCAPAQLATSKAPNRAISVPRFAPDGKGWTEFAPNSSLIAPGRNRRARVAWVWRDPDRARSHDGEWNAASKVA